MNREASIYSSDNLVVVDRSRQQRRMVIAAVVGVVVILLAVFLMFGRGGHKPAPGPTGAVVAVWTTA